MKEKSTINILFIEDSEDDYALIKRRIEHEGLKVNSRRVETAEDYQAALDAISWDIVLSDNALPTFDATRALKITRKKYPFLPFIIVSGTIGEEAAVNAMKSGANDYLLKNDLARLVPAIERELNDIKILKSKHSADLALKESEARYHAVIASMTEGLVIYDSEGSIINYNKSAAKILGLKARNNHEFDIELRERYLFFTPDMQALAHADLPSRITLKEGRSLQTVIGVKCSDELIWLSVNSDPFIQPDGRTGVVLSFSDITEQKLAREKITAVAKELTTLIDTANAPIFGIDWEGKINEWNQVTAKITGYAKHEVMGKKLIDEFILDGYKVPVANLLKKVLRGKDVKSYELPMYTRTEKVVTILFNATARRNQKSEIVGVVGVGQNVTELIEYREQLEMKVAHRTKELHEALQKEKELVALKSKFVSMASHEFRTPLSTISFATSFIKRYYSKLKYIEINHKLEKIEEQVAHMLYLLDDVLLIGKSESGKIKLNRVMIDLSDFCKKIIEEVSYSTKNTHKILFSIATEKKEVYIDDKLLRNIVINLLTNAIKFSPGETKVLLDIACRKDLLALSVKDWGMGIDKEYHEKIFEPFHRTSNVGTIQGTGLGLSIVKKAVELQQGIIEINSAPKKGTMIKIQIPLPHEEDINH